MQTYAVIMAGGGGTRFWPLSRKHKPKQLLNISGNDVMINESIKRLEGLIDIKNILVVTNKTQRDVIKQLLINDLPRENILFEPVGRNTAPCVAFAAAVISARCPDAVMCVLPSDHYITDEARYRSVLEKAINAAEESGKLVTVGIKPTFPSTGYGYIRFNPQSDRSLNGIYEVDEFVEKPGIEKAREYLSNGRYLWNSGVFVWKVSTILESLRRYLPRLYKNMQKIREAMDKGGDSIEPVYSELQSISIDFGVLERSDEVLVVHGDFDWNDVGSWDALGTIFPTDENGNIVKAQHVSLNTRNSIIYSRDRLIATIGLDNVIIADTNDALLVCHKDKAQEVKHIVEMIQKKGLEDYV